MIDTLKIIPELAYELYDSAINLTLHSVEDAVINTTKAIAKIVFATGFYIALTPICPYLLAISFTAGLAFPDYAMEKTSQVYAAIFQTKEIPTLAANAKHLDKIAYTAKYILNYAKPIIATGVIGFFGLPVVSVQIFSVLAGLRLGAYFGKQADLTKIENQYLFHK